MLCGKEPPFDSVYVLGSSADLIGCNVCGLVNGGADGGGGGAVGAVGALNIGAEGGVDGGGGGGGAAGEVCPLPKAFLAACMAIEGVRAPLEKDGKDMGGGGGDGRFEGDFGVGGGGGAGSVNANDGGGGGGGAGAAVEGLRDVMGGGGGFGPPGGGGGALGGVTSGDDCADRTEKEDAGLCMGFGGGLRRFETIGFVG